MGVWNPTTYLNKHDAGATSCIGWNNAQNFDDLYEDTAYYWGQRHSLSRYNVWWNNACAIRLLIDKCNYLQDQIDAGAGGVDMAAIVNAMLAASQDEFTKFIGIVDAYRSALWDMPFNAEFYAALARGFRFWP